MGIANAENLFVPFYTTKPAGSGVGLALAQQIAKAPPFANDPYVLPDHWLTIEIDSEGDAFAVRILADTFEDAKRVLARAKLYVASRPSEVVTVPASASPAEQPKVSLPASGPPPSDPALSQPASTAK